MSGTRIPGHASRIKILEGRACLLGSRPRFRDTETIWRGFRDPPCRNVGRTAESFPAGCDGAACKGCIMEIVRPSDPFEDPLWTSAEKRTGTEYLSGVKGAY